MAKLLEVLDPLIQELSEEACIEKKNFEQRSYTPDSELGMLSGCREMLSVIELAGYSKILVPKTVWEMIVKTCIKLIYLIIA